MLVLLYSERGRSEHPLNYVLHETRSMGGLGAWRPLLGSRIASVSIMISCWWVTGRVGGRSLHSEGCEMSGLTNQWIYAMLCLCPSYQEEQSHLRHHAL